MTLADRIEAAGRPDRELDALIEIARNPYRQIIIGSKPGRFPQEPIYGPISELIVMADMIADAINAPAYTASIDAALTLVPDGHAWSVSNAARTPRANVWPLSPLRDIPPKHTSAATPALAICAAALRAREENTHG